jgi:hypothetical protein
VLLGLLYPKTATQDSEGLPSCVDNFISYYVLMYFLLHDGILWLCVKNYHDILSS